MRWRARPEQDYTKPHLWFAWYPVKATNGSYWFWMEYVYRRDVSISDWGPVWFYSDDVNSPYIRHPVQYTLKPNLTPNKDISIAATGADEKSSLSA